MRNINKELFSLILIIISGILILGFIAGIFYVLNFILDLKNGFLYPIGYVITCFVTYQLSRNGKNRGLRYIYVCIALPFRVIVGLIPIALPYIVLQIHLLVYLLFSAAVPMAFYLLDRTTGLMQLKITTHIYLIVTVSVITATLMNKQMTYLTYLFSPVRLYRSNASKQSEFNRLTDYFLSENNIKFIIYFCYFLYLLIFNLFTFEEHSLYSSPLMDRAVLQSFITFLALERLITNLKDLDFKPSELLKLLLTSITGQNKDLENNGIKKTL